MRAEEATDQNGVIANQPICSNPIASPGYSSTLVESIFQPWRLRDYSSFNPGMSDRLGCRMVKSWESTFCLPTR